MTSDEDCQSVARLKDDRRDLQIDNLFKLEENT